MRETLFVVGYYSFYSIRGLITRSYFSANYTWDSKPATRLRERKKQRKNHFRINFFSIQNLNEKRRILLSIIFCFALKAIDGCLVMRSWSIDEHSSLRIRSNFDLFLALNKSLKKLIKKKHIQGFLELVLKWCVEGNAFDKFSGLLKIQLFNLSGFLLVWSRYAVHQGRFGWFSLGSV